EPNKKMLTMHYHYAESSEVREELDIINRNMMSSQSSLPMINVRIEEMMPGLVSIIWGVILLTPLFRIDTALLPDGFWWMRPSLIIRDRKRTRLNSSNDSISYAVFCFIKKKHHLIHITLINKNLIIKK